MKLMSHDSLASMAASELGGGGDLVVVPVQLCKTIMTTTPVPSIARYYIMTTTPVPSTTRYYIMTTTTVPSITSIIS